MQSLSPLEQLTVDAFTAALETCQEEGVELPSVVWVVAQSPEQHVTELSEIAKSHPQLNAAYRVARKVLRKAESSRKKRMGIDDSVLLRQFNSTLEQPLDSSSKEDTFTTTSNKNSETSENPAKGPTRFGLSKDSDSDAASPSASGRPVIYRYTLPDSASPQAALAFSKQIEMIRQCNPDWVVSFDHPNPGEADAIVLIRKDEHYATTHAAYLMNKTLNQVVGPALARVFGSTTSQMSEHS